MLSTNIGFDSILSQDKELEGTVAVSHSGTRIVSSNPIRGTFSEKTKDHNIPPVQILPQYADKLGFFGENIDLLAMLSGDNLRIFHLYEMRVLKAFKVRPGSLFVPQSGKSRRIGIVSPDGNVFTIDDTLAARKEGVPQTPHGGRVLWSSNAKPIGVAYVDGEEAKISLYPTAPGLGDFEFVSEFGFVIHAVWANHREKRHEVYFSRLSEKNILSRMFIQDNDIVVEEVEVFPNDTVVSGVSCFSDGEPTVATACDGVDKIIRVLYRDQFEPDDVTRVLERVASREGFNIGANCVGVSSLLLHEETPVSEPKPFVVSYSIPGLPKRAVRGLKGVSQDSNPPKVNKVREIKINRKETIRYRIVSPLPSIEDDLLETIVILPDHDGVCSSGTLSKTAKLLYQSGIGVALVPVRKNSRGNPIPEEDYGLDLVDVSIDLKKNLIAKKVVLLANDSLSHASVRAVQHRKSRIDRAYLIEPAKETVDLIKVRKNTGRVSVVDFVDTERKSAIPDKIPHIVLDRNSVDVTNFLYQMTGE